MLTAYCTPEIIFFYYIKYVYSVFNSTQIMNEIKVLELKKKY